MCLCLPVYEDIFVIQMNKEKGRYFLDELFGGLTSEAPPKK